VLFRSQTAIGSDQHTTLVAAVKAAGLVDALSNAGPFTVFAPTDQAFSKLPKGTVDDLLKSENKDALTDILSYHTYVGSLSTMLLQDGQEFEQVNAQKVKISRQGDKIMINDVAEIVATITTSNGIIHVIDNILLPPSQYSFFHFFRRRSEAYCFGVFYLYVVKDLFYLVIPSESGIKTDFSY